MRYFKIIQILIMTLIMYSPSIAKDKPSTIITKEVIINSTIESAWKVLGIEFADAYKWASSIQHSQANDKISFNGSTCSERGCEVSGIGSLKEKILEYSDTEHILYYEVYEGMPKMVKYMTNHWKLTAIGGGKVKLEMKMEMRTGGFIGWLMRGMMKRKMSKTADQIIEEFKYYVEQGKPHPRVLESNKS